MLALLTTARNISAIYANSAFKVGWSPFCSHRLMVKPSLFRSEDCRFKSCWEHKEGSMEKAIIIDIDGTLSDSNHRKHFVEGEEKDWTSFNESMIVDKPNVWCKKIVSAMVDQHDVEVLLITGRFEKYKDFTEDWLYRYSIPYEKLWMRPDEDHQPDTELKQKIYEEHIKDKYEVIFAIDDRKRVVDMWRKLGIICLQCAEGNF